MTATSLPSTVIFKYRQRSGSMMYKQNAIQYEYVPETVYGEPQRTFELQILPYVRSRLYRNGISFQCSLIGSASRHLVTRRRDMTKGFDLDYNLELQRHPDDPEFIKRMIIEAFDSVAPGYGYEHCEDSTTVITIKKLTKAGDKIHHSFDIAVTAYGDDDIYYIHFDKKSKRYIWNPRGGQIHLERKIECIQRYYNDDVYSVIADEYLHLKNTNRDGGKRSFCLCAEAINNEYNHIQQI